MNQKCNFSKLKQLFLPNKELILIHINRDSVCIGDDTGSHEEIYKMKRDATLSDLFRKVNKKDYLAYIHGGKATWLVINLKKEIAVIAQQWSKPRYLSGDGITRLSELEKINDRISIHFRYLGQQDPDWIFNDSKTKQTNL